MVAAVSLRPSTRAFAVAELLEMAKDQHLPVDRVHAVERLLELSLPLGADRHLAGPGVAAQEPRRQRRRARRRIRPAVDRDLTPGVPRLGPELTAMHDLQPLERQEPQPQERRHRIRLAIVLGPALGGLEERLLDHVRGVDPAAQPMIQPDRDHPPQPVAVRREEFAPVRAIVADRRNTIPFHGFPRMARRLVRADK